MRFILFTFLPSKMVFHILLLVLHVCFIRPLLDFNITTHAHARILYDCNSSHVPSKNAKDFQFVLIVMCKFLLHFIFVTLL